MQRECLRAESGHNASRRNVLLLSPSAYIRTVNCEASIGQRETAERQNWRETQGRGVQDPNVVDRWRIRHGSRTFLERQTTVRRVNDYYGNRVTRSRYR